MALDLPKLPPDTRLATYQDIWRIGLVATAALRYSPTFTWYRPYHNQSPEDTYRSYSSIFLESLQRPDHIVLVATDRFEADEGLKTLAHVPVQLGQTTSDKEVVVGVIVVALAPDETRSRQNLNDCPSHMEAIECQKRDQHAAHDEQLNAAAAALIKQHFDGVNMMELEMLAVHPAYWGRGHAKRLVRWCMDLSTACKNDMFVLATDMSASICRKLGWKETDELRLEGDEVSPDGVKMTMLLLEALHA